MTEYMVIWLTIVISTFLLAIVLVPSDGGRVNDVLDILKNSEHASTVEKYMQVEPNTWIERQKLFLEQSRTGISWETYIAIFLISCASFYLLGWFVFGNPIVSIIAIPIGLSIPKTYVDNKRRALSIRFNSELIRPLERMIAALSAKKTPIQAVEEVAIASNMPHLTQREFAQAFSDITYGKNIEDAFFDMSHRTGSGNVLFMAAQIAINREQGGNLADVLSKVKESIMEDERLKRDALTQTAEQLSQTKIMMGISIIATIAMLIMQPTTRQFILNTTGGRMLLAFNISMMLIGKVIINKLIQPSSPELVISNQGESK